MQRRSTNDRISPAIHERNRGGGVVLRADYRTYTVIYERDNTGAFLVRVPALKGVHTFGETLEEARAMAKEAIEGYLETLAAHGMPIPAGEEQNQKRIRELLTVAAPAK